MAMAAATVRSAPLRSALRSQVCSPAAVLTALGDTSTQPHKVVRFVDDGWTEKSGKGLAHAHVHAYVVNQDAWWLSGTTSGGHDRPGLDFGCDAVEWRHKGSPSSMVGKRGELTQRYTTEEVLSFLDSPTEFLQWFFDGCYTTRLFPKPAIARAAMMSCREFLESDDDDQWKPGREWFKVDKKGQTVYQGEIADSVVSGRATAHANEVVGEYLCGGQDSPATVL